ncbi:MAG: hypothetical protein WCJ17_03550, partial [bacterium]
MFRLYFTVILGCCLLAAQPTMSHAASSTSKKPLHSMLSKKKRRRAIYIAVGSTVLMAVAVGAGVFLCKTRRRSQSFHANGSGEGSPDGENPANTTGQPVDTANSDGLGSPEGSVLPYTPEGANHGLEQTLSTDTPTGGHIPIIEPSVAERHDPASPQRLRRENPVYYGPIPRIPESPPASPSHASRLLDDSDMTTPVREHVSQKSPGSDLNVGRIEDTPEASTGAGCGSTG